MNLLASVPAGNHFAPDLGGKGVGSGCRLVPCLAALDEVRPGGIQADCDLLRERARRIQSSPFAVVGINVPGHAVADRGVDIAVRILAEQVPDGGA
jgi:hypothetical protein